MKNQAKNPVRWHILFEGNVQFVGFRYTARVVAGKLGLTGWVRNLPDGCVESEVQGELVDLRRFLLKLKFQPQFHIEHYTVAEIAPDPDERRFSIRGFIE